MKLSKSVKKDKYSCHKCGYLNTNRRRGRVTYDKEISQNSILNYNIGTIITLCII